MQYHTIMYNTAIYHILPYHTISRGPKDQIKRRILRVSPLHWALEPECEIFMLLFHYSILYYTIIQYIILYDTILDHTVIYDT